MRKNNLKLGKIVEEFNNKYPVGTEVIVVKDFGEEVRTKTGSIAWVLGGHTPVVMLEDITGCYDLSRVHPIRDE